MQPQWSSIDIIPHQGNFIPVSTVEQDLTHTPNGDTWDFRAPAWALKITVWKCRMHMQAHLQVHTSTVDFQLETSNVHAYPSSLA